MSKNHPLRRISTGSLSSLARSQDRANTSPSGLDFLAPALTELADEAATLTQNVQRMNHLHDALDRFNEGFAAYMYALKMNAFCVEWPEAPDQNTWKRVEEARKVQAAQPAPEPQVQTKPKGRPPPSPAAPSHADMTYATVMSVEDAPKCRTASASTANRRPQAAPAVKAAPSAAQRKAAMAAKKKRELEISRIIDTQLPLEYRGGDPDLRLVAEQVIAKLMESNGCAIAQITSPRLSHPKVNKCLIALVAKKLVGKNMVDGRTVYYWEGA